MGVLVQLCLGLRTVSTITDLHIILAGALIFFGFCNKDGDEKIINPVFVNEDTGKAEIYFPPDYDETTFHENCEVPEEFRPVGIRN